MKDENSKISSIVLLRGIAALGVCLVHIQLLSGYHFNKIVDFIVSNGQLGVALFFVISGFVLPYSLYKFNYKLNVFFKFILKRSIRIDPAYWASIVLVLMPFSTPIDFKSIAFHIFYLVPFINGANWYNGIYWTLSIEFQFYLLLGLSYPFLMRINPYLSTLIIILISAVFIFNKFDHRGIIFTNLYDFVFGFIAFMAYVKKIDFKKALVLLILYALFVMFTVSIKSGAVPLMGVVFILFYNVSSKIPLFHFIGEISFSLYLVHSSVSWFFITKAGPFVSNQFILFAGSLLSSMVFAYVFYALIEEPCRKLSKKIHF